jgi:pentose-5-phosphate-3-epimerase
MSKKPSKWIKHVIDYSDIIYLHWEIIENLENLRKLILSHNKKFGLAITIKTPPKKILKILKKSSALLILSIDNPGFSGQKFNLKTFDYIEFFNGISFRNKFKICIDGGVDKNILKILNVDDVVSNSSILRSNTPAAEIVKFQSTKYNE